MNIPELIVMLTHNDRTLQNACEIFEKCKNSDAEYWGLKEEGIPFEHMKKLFDMMKNCGKTTALEVVAYSEKECLEGAKTAAYCGCDILMGTKFFDSVNFFCKENNIRYMPFVGEVSGRPSILCGTAESMVKEAKELLEKGVYGFDLLGYRFCEDAFSLCRKFVSEVDAPVCIAGSINSFERLDEIKAINPWAFTVGGAFSENKFGDDFCSQINAVSKYIKGGIENA